jgi:hypothetical protein
VGAIIVYILITIVLVVISVYLGGILYMKGMLAGMRREADQWMNAIGKVTPPNWQSLPSPAGVDPEQSKEARKLYVDTYKTALDLIKREIANNRIDALTEEFLKEIESAERS